MRSVMNWSICSAKSSTMKSYLSQSHWGWMPLRMGPSHLPIKVTDRGASNRIIGANHGRRLDGQFSRNSCLKRSGEDLGASTLDASQRFETISAVGERKMWIWAGIEQVSEKCHRICDIHHFIVIDVDGCETGTRGTEEQMLKPLDRIGDIQAIYRH